MPRRGPSQVRPGELYTVRLYLTGSVDPEVYDDCKHVFMSAGNTLIVVLQVFPADGTHRYLYWLREHVRWFQVVPKWCEEQWRE